MGLPVRVEPPLEEHVGRIEAGIDHLCREASETKADIRELRRDVQSVDVRLTAKIDGVDTRLVAKIDEVDRRLSAKIDPLMKSLASAKVWALILYIGLAATLLGKMERDSALLTARQDDMRKELTVRQDDTRKEFVARTDAIQAQINTLQAEMRAGFANIQARLDARAPGR